MTEQEKRKKFNKMVGDFIKKEVGYEDESEDIKTTVENPVVWIMPDKKKKYVQNYICEKCGRIKTVRFTYIPTPASHGKCPRCKEGRMLADYIKSK